MRRISPATLSRRIAIPSPALLRGQTSRIALPGSPSFAPSRPIFSFLKRKPSTSTNAFTPPAAPLLSQTDLFHPLSQSPFPALREKAARIKASSLCPTSFERYGERLRPEYECPDCGFPTHASRARWEEGRDEHMEYCGRLREVNEDEHDIRSGRQMREFEDMPGE